MEKYSIYCTEEQTKKALELGASLEFIPMFRYGDNSLPKFVHKNKWNLDEFCYCPTAEQMLGWLEDRGILVEFTRFMGQYAFRLLELRGRGERNLHIKGQDYSSRKEVMLNAIDAALEYLLNEK